MANTTLEQTAKSAVGICRCGKEYDPIKRREESGNRGSAAEYDSDHCWINYTSSDDAVEPNLMTVNE
ncbi:hypothetical protein A3K73_03550 [Candidatus Pacearchaeota archaeon RBG_13_36_9]|nr:MAG: hypothetical protein A3K73_03550 [Candidatus Pacearchaeota archaeon RBG_13_36_9]HJX50177.1 hypothetical protein [Candidatus Nanoarchaeia archaeon]